MNALIIANTQIRRDASGRYCLNDLHQASGGEKRHQPSDWLRTQQTQDLVAELKIVRGPDGQLREIPELNPVETTEGRYGGGTYAVKELVYAYAMWISARFHLEVIRAYDALVTAAVGTAAPVPGYPQVDHRADQLVSAGRIFGAALRTARHMRLSPGRALRAAARVTERHTGIDWPDELGATDVLAEPPAPAIADDPMARFVAAWREGHLGVPYVPAMSTAVFAVYARWCQDNGERALNLPRFVAEIRRRGVLCMRKRYATSEGLRGPAGFLWPEDIQPPTGETESAWLGACVAEFNDAAGG